MAGIISLEMLGYRDIAGRFSKRTDEIARAQRDEIRALGRSGVELLRHYAPKDTGEFAKGIRYRTTEKAKGTRLTFYASGEHAFLLPIITEGTSPHPIPKGGSAEQMAKGYPLHWVDEGGADHFAWSVMHPGTVPDPFVERALDAFSPQMAMALQRVARRVVWLT